MAAPKQDRRAPAYDQARPVKIELGLLGLAGTQPFTPIPIENSLLSFRYNLVGESAGDDTQFTFIIELINPLEEVEDIIQAVYARLYAAVGGKSVKGTSKFSAYPKLLIRWGYGDQVEDGLSQVHVAAISNVKYKFNDRKEKILTIEAKDMLNFSRSTNKDAFISRGTNLFRPSSSKEPHNLIVRDVGDIALELLEKALLGVPDTAAIYMPDIEIHAFIQNVVERLKELEYDMKLPVSKELERAFKRIPDAPNRFHENADENRKAIMTLHVLKKIGFDYDFLDEDATYYLIKLAKLSGGQGIITNVLSSKQLDPDDAGTMSKINEAWGTIQGTKSISTIEEENIGQEGVVQTKLIIGTDVTDFFGTYDPDWEGLEATIQSTADSLSAQAAEFGVDDIYSVLLDPPPEVLTQESADYWASTDWLLTPAGKAKVAPIAKNLDSAYSHCAAGIHSEEYDRILEKAQVLNDTQDAALNEVQRFTYKELSKKENKEALFNFFGNTTLIGQGKNCIVKFVSPLGSDLFEDVETKLNNLNLVADKRFDGYKIWTIPPNHLLTRTRSMRQVAEEMLDDSFPSLTMVIGTYQDAILSSKKKGAVPRGVGSQVLRVRSFEDINMYEFEDILQNQSSDVNINDFSYWSKLSYGPPNSIVKFFDFNGEMWYLVNRLRGVVLASQARNNFDYLSTHRPLRVLGNFLSRQDLIGESERRAAIGATAQSAAMPYIGTTGALVSHFDNGEMRVASDVLRWAQMPVDPADNTANLPLTFTYNDMQKLKSLLAKISDEADALLKDKAITSEDREALIVFAAYMNTAGGATDLFDTTHSFDGFRGALINFSKLQGEGEEGNIMRKSLDELYAEGVNKSLWSGSKVSVAPMQYVLRGSSFNRQANSNAGSLLKEAQMASRLLDSRYAAQIRIKTLGIPEFDTVGEIYKRRIFFAIRDITRERYLAPTTDSQGRMTTTPAMRQGSKTQLHWLTGVYRPLAISHVITPKEGYTTEIKLFRDPETTAKQATQIAEQEELQGR